MRSNHFKRREFITLITGGALMPVVVDAQQAIMPVIGFLNPGSPEANASLVAAYRKGLSESGFVEGQNVAIEFRWANGQYDRLPELAADLVRRHVALIATPVNTAASLAAKAATATIPVVFAIGTDPVEAGLVASFSRPGGNLTGISGMNWELGTKRLGLLHELLPGGGRIGVLINPNTGETEPFLKDVERAAFALGRQIESLPARSSREIDDVFAGLAQKKGVNALLIPSDQLFLNRRVQLVGLSLRQGIPSIYPWREAVEIGGLMSYASSFSDLFRQAGIYTARILKGEKPANLPVMQASRFEFVINLQTARTLGIEIPATLLARADEAIE
jgi:putative tryptophan/tyrosine transport system substrate-binding protein